MKGAFPYMGVSHLAFKQLMLRLGHDLVMPPTPTKRTITYGVRYSPEFACMPFKVLLGTYIEVLEKGANLLVSSGGIGPCRAGLYGMLHEKILEDLGYKFRLVILDPPYYNLKQFVDDLAFLKTPNLGWTRFVKEVTSAWQKLNAVERLEKLLFQTRAFELKRGDATKAYEQGLEVMDAAVSPKEISSAEQEAISLLKVVPTDRERTPLKIGIVGEIYVVLEPALNFNIERYLGERGCLVRRAITVSDFTRGTWSSKERNAILKTADPYLKQLVGGHGINSVGETILYAREGFDGVVQLAPFTCIPEIVAKSILPKVSDDFGIAVLTLNIDEQTAQTGVETRLEAFLELLHEKRLQMEATRTDGCLSGS